MNFLLLKLMSTLEIVRPKEYVQEWGFVVLNQGERVALASFIDMGALSRVWIQGTTSKVVGWLYHSAWLVDQTWTQR